MTSLPFPDLLASQVQQFHTDGYVLVEDAFPPAEIAATLAIINRLKSKLETSAHRRDVFGLDVRPLVTEDDHFLKYMEWPATFPLAVRCLNHFSLQLQTSHLIMVPPKAGIHNIGWHQDGGSPGSYVGGIRALASLKVGFFLTDLLQPDMGQLMVIPGSHRRAEPPVVPADGSDPVGAIQLRVKAGTAVVFHQGLYHGGAVNTSDRTRIVLYYGYGFRWTKPIDYDTMPADLLARCTPIGRQLLGAKATHLGYYIPTDADCPLKASFRDWFGETWVE